MSVNPRRSYFDLLRVLACFAVILLHYSGSYNYRFGIPTFNAGIQFFTLTRWCVPVFLMISGALLLQKNYDLALFYRKRLLRILPPFLFWSFVYISFKLYNNETEWNRIDDLLLLEGAEFHLWYVYLILGLILFVPFITPWTEKKESRTLLAYLIIWVAWLVFFNFFSVAYLGVDLTYFGGYLGYMILGYYLSIMPPGKFQWMIGVFLYVGGFLYSYYSTVTASYVAQTFVQSSQHYLSWNVMLMASGVFLFFKQFRLQGVLAKIITEISQFSFSIYLAHIIIRDTIVKDYFSFLYYDDYSFLLVKSLLLLLLSYLVAKLLSKLPIIGRYISG